MQQTALSNPADDNLPRTLMTIGCRDCDAIPKVADAGRIVRGPDGDVQIMHNGLRVVAGGYHGDWMAQIIRALRGHHEPQEERVFHALLDFVRHGSLIVELGAFWSYYTLWYLTEIPGSNAICVEPDPSNFEVGRRNIALNGATERVRQVAAWVGGSALDRASFVCETAQAPRELPMVDMNAVAALAEGRVIELLHMDVQGFELPFIRSMTKAVADRKLRFVVVSTHHGSISGSATTHADCIKAIEALGGHVLVEHDVQESFSGDGLIVASFLPHDRALSLPEISRNEAARSLFPRP